MSLFPRTDIIAINLGTRSTINIKYFFTQHKKHGLTTAYILLNITNSPIWIDRFISFTD